MVNICKKRKLEEKNGKKSWNNLDKNPKNVKKIVDLLPFVEEHILDKTFGQEMEQNWRESEEQQKNVGHAGEHSDGRPFGDGLPKGGSDQRNHDETLARKKGGGWLKLKKMD